MDECPNCGELHDRDEHRRLEDAGAFDPGHLRGVIRDVLDAVVGTEHEDAAVGLPADQIDALRAALAGRYEYSTGGDRSDIAGSPLATVDRAAGASTSGGPPDFGPGTRSHMGELCETCRTFTIGCAAGLRAGMGRCCSKCTHRDAALQALEADRGGHAAQGAGRQYLSNACIHDKHAVCDEECAYCHDGCACACHPWNASGGSSIREGGAAVASMDAPPVDGASGVASPGAPTDPTSPTYDPGDVDFTPVIEEYLTDDEARVAFPPPVVPAGAELVRCGDCDQQYLARVCPWCGGNS